MFRSLASKVALITTGYLTVIGIISAFTLSSVFALRDTAIHLSATTAARLSANAHFRLAMQESISEAQAFVIQNNPSEYIQAREALDEADEALTGLTPANASADRVALSEAATYAQLYTKRRAVFEQTRELIAALPTLGAAARHRTLLALEELEGNHGELEQDVDRLLEQDIARTNDIVVTQLQHSTASLGVLLAICLLLCLGALLLLSTAIIRPIKRLSMATTGVTRGDLDVTVPPTGQDEVGTLQRNFNTMVATIRQQTHALEQEVAAANTARQAAEWTRQELVAQLATIADQRAVIREMSVPILPLLERAIVVPLIGVLDSDRLGLVREKLLRAINLSPTRHVIIDVTGVPVIDLTVAQGIRQVVQAVGLLGARVTLVGIRPEVAQTLVSLGDTFGQITVQSTLQSGIAAVLRELRIGAPYEVESAARRSHPRTSIS